MNELAGFKYACSHHVDPDADGIFYRVVAYLNGDKVFAILKVPEELLDHPDLDKLMYAACRERLEADVVTDLPALLERTARGMTLEEIETAVLDEPLTNLQA